MSSLCLSQSSGFGPLSEQNKHDENVPLDIRRCAFCLDVFRPEYFIKMMKQILCFGDLTTTLRSECGQELGSLIKLDPRPSENDLVHTQTVRTGTAALTVLWSSRCLTLPVHGCSQHSESLLAVNGWRSLRSSDLSRCTPPIASVSWDRLQLDATFQRTSGCRQQDGQSLTALLMETNRTWMRPKQGCFSDYMFYKVDI